MSKFLVVCALLSIGANAFSVKNHIGVPKTVFLGEVKSDSSGPATDGYWSHLFAPPFSECPSVMFGISCMNTSNCYVPAGVDGVGFGVTKFDGSPGGQFVPMDMPSKPMMLMAIGVGGDNKSPLGAVGGMGFGNAVQYLSHNGTMWETSDLGDAPQFFPTQCIRASADGRRVLSVVAEAIGNELPMVLYSTNGGKNFTTHRIDVPVAAPGCRLRYAAIPTPDVWYVTAGAWPKATAPEDAIFNPKETHRVHANVQSESFALSESLAVVRDKSTYRYKLRDMLKDAPPTMKAGRGYSAQIFRTTDGGKTFKSVFEDVDTFYFNGIDCVDARTCYAVGSGDKAVYIYGTRDGGDSWKVVYELPRTYGAYYSLMSIGVTEGTVIAAGGGQSGSGYESFTLTSEDGVTWTRQAGLPGIGDIAAMSLLPGGYGFATAVTVYQTSTILALRPKGSPTLPPPPTQATFQQVSCTDAKCSENCEAATWRQNKCLSIGGGRSVIVQCDTERGLLIQDFFDSSRCDGNATRRPLPLNVCLKAAENDYYENIC